MYKIDSRQIIVWRSPTSLQSGVDEPTCVIENISAPVERFISALRTGFSHSQLHQIAQDCELPLSEAQHLLEQLSPSLITETCAKKFIICIDGTGVLSDSVGSLLVQEGHTVIRGTAAMNIACDIALVFGDFVIEPHRTGGWLSREIVHVPIITGDVYIQLGPVLGGPAQQLCAHCLYLHKKDLDPSWPAIASQVWGKPASLATPLVRAHIAYVMARWIITPDSMDISPTSMLRVNAQSGMSDTQLLSFHPECSCQALPENATRVGEENEPH